MRTVLWLLAGNWTEASPVERAALAPVLYLRTVGLRSVLVSEDAEAPWPDDTVALVLAARAVPGVAVRRRLEEASARGVRLLVMPCGALDAATLLDGLASAAVDDVVVPDWSGDACLGRAGPSAIRLPVAPARLAEDALLRWMLGCPPSVAGRSDDDGRFSLFCVAETVDALSVVSPALLRAGADKPLDLLVVGSDPERLGARLRELGLSGRVASMSAPEVLVLLAAARTALVPLAERTYGTSLPGGWVRAALAAGVPVIATSHPSLDDLAEMCVLDDWDRGLALYVGGGGRRRAAGALRGQAYVFAAAAPTAVAAAWGAELGRVDKTPAGDGAARRLLPDRRPTLLVQFDLGQDLDVLLPIIEACLDRGVLNVRAVVTHWLKEESPRVVERLHALGLPYETVARKAARAGEGASLAGVDAVLTATESTLRAHKAGHALARRAHDAGIPTFTIQHGFENSGISYRDDEHGDDVVFASDTVFVWCPLAAVPDWVRPETRAKLIAVGSPKPTPPPSLTVPLPADDRWRYRIGVFENLHWHRYDDSYREAFVADLLGMARSFPDVLFMVKPHHAGRWLIKSGALPAGLANLLLIDPTEPRWHAFTAPVLINALDSVITTPSTVAVDAARAGRRVAVVGYRLDLPVYAPLPILRGTSDWAAFVAVTGDGNIDRNEAFLARTLVPGCSDHRIAARIEAAVGS